MTKAATAPVLAALLAAAPPAGAAAPPEDPASADRWAPRDPVGLTVPRRPVLRRDYVEFLRPHARGFENGPDRGTYGPRHGLPALAVYALEGDPALAAGLKKTLRHYGDWVRQSVAEQRGVFSMEGATLCSFYFRELRRHGHFDAEDERFARELLLTLREYQMAWRPGDGLWRGPHHRSQTQGSNHALAAAFYPGEPDAPAWAAYAERVWCDWWDFRDVGINDTGYYHSSFGTILRTAELLGRTEVFTDPAARRLFDRILHELSPDGQAVPYGSHGGFNGSAGARIFALELAARHTRDGRYRWGAERLMNHGQARGFSAGHHHVHAVNIEDVALASLVCDDTVAAVEPEAGSALLTRKEVRRLSDREARELFPDAGGVDCNMYMTEREMPHKAVFRSGWAPGDLFMMVECYPRHDPLNPTAVVALQRWSASFAEMVSEKFISRENAVKIEDLAGAARFHGRTDGQGRRHLPVGYERMETGVPVFADAAAATHARIRVDGYMGYEAAHEREILFVKNRFVLVRDETVFDDAFPARIGPVWNTQHVGEPRGEHWLNTWFSRHSFQTARLYEVPPWDLLVYHAPREGARLVVRDHAGEATLAEPKGSALGDLYSTGYEWEGEVSPGRPVSFVQVLLPHAPVRDATPVAARIAVLADEPGLAAVTVRGDGEVELALVNPEGRELSFDAPALSTDARAGYARWRGGVLVEVCLFDARFAAAAGHDLFRGDARRGMEAVFPDGPADGGR